MKKEIQESCCPIREWFTLSKKGNINMGNLSMAIRSASSSLINDSDVMHGFESLFLYHGHQIWNGALRFHHVAA